MSLFNRNYPQRIDPKPGQESVWDYPRPPRLERVTQTLRIEFGGLVLAETTQAYRVLETSHPPTYYLPPADVSMDYLTATNHRSLCEWKGAAQYWHVKVSHQIAENAAWSYPTPTSNFRAIQDYLSFYANLMDACYVGDERVDPQAGSFYGGWVTSNIVGPFKGGPGTRDW